MRSTTSLSVTSNPWLFELYTDKLLTHLYAAACARAHEIDRQYQVISFCCSNKADSLPLD